MILFWSWLSDEHVIQGYQGPKGIKHLIDLRDGMNESRNSLQSLLVKQPSQA